MSGGQDDSKPVDSVDSRNELQSQETSGNLLWDSDTGGSIRSSPTVADGTVFVGSRDNSVYALDVASGDQVWQFETLGQVESSPAVSNGTVFVGSYDKNVYALDANSGELQGGITTGDRIRSSPTVVDGTVFVGSYDGGVYALDVVSGEQQWVHDTDWSVQSSPTVVDNTVYVGSRDNSVYALDADSGEQRWTYDTGGSVRSSPTVVDETVFVGSHDQNVYAIDATSGEDVWIFETDNWVYSSPTVADGTVFVGSMDNKIYALDADSGAEEWSFDTGWVVQSSPTVVNETVFVGSNDNNLYAFDAATGELVGLYETGDSIRSSPTVVAGTAFVGSYDNSLYAFETMVDGSSEGSRARLKTLGHHDRGEQSNTGSSVDVDETGARIPEPTTESADTKTTEWEPAPEPSEGRADTESPSEAKLAETTTGATAGGDKSSVFAVVDDSVQKGDDLHGKARSHRDAGEYDQALEATEGAQKAYDEALDMAAGQTLIDTDAIEEKIANLDTTQRNTRRQQLQDAIESTRSSLDQAETLSDEGNLDVAQETLADLESDLTALQETATEHDFVDLREELSSLEQRREDHLESIDKGLPAGPPEEIPRAPDVSVEYDTLTDRETIGAGGNADVTRAALPTPGGEATVAIKEPRMGGGKTLHTETVERMMTEAETWQRLDNHNHIVSVLGYGSEPLPWIAMEYMDAGHLGERADNFQLEQALWTAIATTQAVRHAHDRGVAHLDLKPANILFRSVEEAWDAPKVADWGLSKHLLEHSQSVEGMSPHYAAPEQFDTDRYGPTDNITDVYQLGAVFYELFTGRPPFEGQTFEVINKIQSERPAPPSEVADVPEALDEVLLTALATKKDDRYEHVLYLRDELQDLRDGLESGW